MVPSTPTCALSRSAWDAGISGVVMPELYGSPVAVASWAAAYRLAAGFVLDPRKALKKRFRGADSGQPEE
jgi:hypothetical protein